MRQVPPPPELARRLLALALPADAREHIIADLDEVYLRLAEQQGKHASVNAFDAVTFLGMSSVMLAVALLASYIPAHRASSVDPMPALRGE